MFCFLGLEQRRAVLVSLPAELEEEGRGTRNGYEASKGSKGISGL